MTEVPPETSQYPSDHDLQSQDQREPETCALFVGNIAYEIEEEDLRQLFSQHASVHAVRIVASENKRFAFVDIYGKENAEKVICALHNFDLAGRQLIVKVSVPRGEGGPPPKRSNYRGYEGTNFAGRGRVQQPYFNHFPNGWQGISTGGVPSFGLGNTFFNNGWGMQSPTTNGRPTFGPGSDNYRTRPCRHFAQGSCSYGDRCTYSHDPNMHANFAQNFNSRGGNNFQPRPCRHFAQGSCTFGDRCKYLHDGSVMANAEQSLLATAHSGANELPLAAGQLQ